MLRRSAAAFVLSILGGFGCSDAVGDPPRGNLAIQLGSTPDRPDGTKCPSIGHNANIGVPGPTLSQPGQRIEDGEGAAVNCSVKGGDPYNFTTQISQGSISFFMRGTVAAQGTGTSTLVYTDNQLGATMENAADKPCTVAVNEHSLQVAKGRIWASFECPQIRAQPTYYCSAKGVFVFENCDD
jgi:hypothetical protein